MIAHRSAIRPLSGYRTRMQMAGEIFKFCPSLLDDLLFFTLWKGPQCVDVISGNALTNSPNPVRPTDWCSFTNAGRYVSASSNYLTAWNIDFSSPFSISVWYYPPATMAAYGGLLTKYDYGLNARSISILHDTTSIGLAVSADGITPISVYIQRAVVPAWHLISAINDGTTSRLYYDAQYQGEITSSILSSTVPVMIGARLNSGTPITFANGSIGPCYIWKRQKSDREEAATYAGGYGIDL
jgi:hypothetical protein